MSLYVDTSALLKRYISEDESDACERILLGDPSWVTARHTRVEVVRNLSKLLAGAERSRMKKIFAADWSRFYIVELDDTTCRRAGGDAAGLYARRAPSGCRRARRGSALPFVTYDVRQAQAARSLGWTVLGR